MAAARIDEVSNCILSTPENMPPFEFLVYAFDCPKTGERMYIGQSGNFWARYKQHYRASAKVSCWIQKLDHENLRPVIQILARSADEQLVKAAEIRLIRAHQALGECRFNERATEPTPVRVKYTNGRKVIDPYIVEKRKRNIRKRLKLSGREWDEQIHGPKPDPKYDRHFDNYNPRKYGR